MPKYLIQASYTVEGTKGLLQSPKWRHQASDRCECVDETTRRPR